MEHSFFSFHLLNKILTKDITLEVNNSLLILKYNRNTKFYSTAVKSNLNKTFFKIEQSFFLGLMAIK